MPKKFDTDTADTTPQPVGQYGSLRNWLAGGLRVGSGLLSGEGGLLGAGISGGGEALAELAEGSPLSLPRIGVEAGIGAVPLGKYFKMGHALETGLKSGAMGVAGEAGRELAKGEKLDPTKIATTGVISGVSAGALSKAPELLSKFFGAKGAQPAEKAAGEVVPTAQTGEGTGVLKPGTPGKQKGRVPDSTPKGDFNVGDSGVNKTRKSTEIPYRMEEPKGTAIPEDIVKPGTEGQVPYAPPEPAPYRPAAKAAVREEQKAAERAAKEAQATKDEEEAIRLREEKGLTQENYNSSSTVGANGEKFTTTYSAPNEANIADKASVEAAAAPPVETVTSPPSTAPPVPEAPPQTPLGKILKPKKSKVQKYKDAVDKNVAQSEAIPPTPEPPPSQGATLVGEPVNSNPLGDLFKTTENGSMTGMTGLNYRIAKEAAKNGEITPEQLAKIRQVHMDELAKAKGVVPTPATPEPPVDPNAWIQQGHDDLARMKADPTQRGAVNPSLLRGLLGLTGAAIGAPIGAANSNKEDRLEGGIKGALVGGGLGIAGPSVIEAFQHPEGIVAGISNAARKLPAIQRANLLTSSYGLPANAVAGPYGSLLMSGIEKTLAGDPLGPEILKQAHPGDFLREMPKHFEEAKDLIGRAEGTSLNAGADAFDKAAALPGTLMTAGDRTSVAALERAGVSEPAAREITLTNEPWNTAPKKLASLSKKSPFLQMLFPFSRTTANIAEQGAMRTPGLGFFVHRGAELAGRPADSLRTKLTQQALGTAVGGGAGLVGANIDDPENAKIAKRFISNAAGQYSLPAQIGFAAGQAYHTGKNPFTAGGTELADALPLPSARPAQDFVNAGVDLTDYLQGNKDFNQVRIPHAAYPGILRELPDVQSLRDLFTPQNSSPVVSPLGRPTTKKFLPDTE
jgi:hypothetical protein